MTDAISSLAASTTSAATLGQSATDQTKLVNDYTDFLTLLTAQLQNQNPLEPMDSKEFTNQLTQFSGVEQSIQSNKLLEQIIATSQSSMATSLVGYLGNTITAEGNQTKLENGVANWRYQVDGDATQADITIRNAQGATVYQDTIPTSDGLHGFGWDGKTKNGNQLADGIYSIEITAKDTTGQTYAVGTEISGVVDGVDMSGTTPVLAIGTATFPVSAVRSVSQ